MLAAVGQRLLDTIDAEDSGNTGGDPAGEGIYDSQPKEKKKRAVHQRWLQRNSMGQDTRKR